MDENKSDENKTIGDERGSDDDTNETTHRKIGDNLEKLHVNS